MGDGCQTYHLTSKRFGITLISVLSIGCVALLYLRWPFGQKIAQRQPEEAFEAAAIDEPSGQFRLANVVVIDGDTIKADVLMPWGVTLSGRTIRAADYDAWEKTRARRSVEVTDEEIRLGKLATVDLQALLASAENVTASPVAREHDTYGRLLAVLTVDPTGPEGPTSLAEWMKARGHVRARYVVK